MKILIAEDDVTSRTILQAVLAKWGYEVTSTGDGDEAFAAFQQNDAPQLAVLDWEMPGLDGAELCRKLRGQERKEPLYLILLTSRSDSGDIVQGLESGADDYIAKPYNNAELKARIEAGRRMIAIQDQLAEKNSELESLHGELRRQYDIASKVFAKIMQNDERQCGNVKYLLSSMETANGDFVISVPKPSGGVYAILGDFTGHGLSAAIGAVPVANIFNAMTDKNHSVCDIVSEINANLKELLPTGMFLVACLLALEFSSGTLTVWNGGLPDILVVGRQGGIKHRIASNHLPLGVTSNERMDLSVDLIEVEPDDRIYVYSDGVTETFNADGEMFGQQRLEEHFQQVSLQESFLETIKTTLDMFRANTPQSDDITMIEIICNAEVAGSLKDVEPVKNGRKETAGINKGVSPCES